MGQLVNLIGMKMGKLSPIERAGSNNHKKALWLCLCDCGNKTITIGADMISGKSRSCGCGVVNSTIERSTTHGKSKTEKRLYNIWKDMKYRCNVPKCKVYHHYGGRGISVCYEWSESVESFIDWAYKNGYQSNLTIERKDVNGNYEPSNCTWITQAEQLKNRRDTT